LSNQPIAHRERSPWQAKLHRWRQETTKAHSSLDLLRAIHSVSENGIDPDYGVYSRNMAPAAFSDCRSTVDFLVRRARGLCLQYCRDDPQDRSNSGHWAELMEAEGWLLRKW